MVPGTEESRLVTTTIVFTIIEVFNFGRPVSPYLINENICNRTFILWSDYADKMR